MAARLAWLLALLALGCGARTGLDLGDAGERDAGECAPEVCNGLDDDCDAVPDDGLACFTLDGASLTPFEGEACGAAWYSYDSPDRESANPTPDIRIPDGVVIGTQWEPGCDGAYVALIADVPMDDSGGELLARWQLRQPDSPAFPPPGLVVSDEPNECSHDPATGAGSCTFRWMPCCTDGFLLGPWREDGCVELSLSGARGVSAPVVLDGAGARIPLPENPTIELCAQIRPRVD